MTPEENPVLAVGKERYAVEILETMEMIKQKIPLPGMVRGLGKHSNRTRKKTVSRWGSLSRSMSRTLCWTTVREGRGSSIEARSTRSIRQGWSWGRGSTRRGRTRGIGSGSIRTWTIGSRSIGSRSSIGWLSSQGWDLTHNQGVNLTRQIVGIWVRPELRYSGSHIARDRGGDRGRHYIPSSQGSSSWGQVQWDRH